MRRIYLIIWLAVLASILNWSTAFGDFYVIPSGGPPVGTVISKLPYTISSPGLYYLRQNVNSSGDGITVNADDVTILLNGFSLIGPGSGDHDGVYMHGRSNVEIRNGTIRGFRYGINEDDSSNGRNHRVIDVRLFSSWASSITLSGSHHVVRSCSVSDSGSDGIFLGPCGLVIGNMVSNTDRYGIRVGWGSTVSQNIAYDAPDSDFGGISGITAFWGSTVTGNTVYNSRGNGIEVGSGSTVSGNTARNNSGIGLDVDGDSVVFGNTAYGNGTDMDTCSPCTVGYNYAPTP